MSYLDDVYQAGYNKGANRYLKVCLILSVIFGISASVAWYHAGIGKTHAGYLEHIVDIYELAKNLEINVGRYFNELKKQKKGGN